MKKIRYEIIALTLIIVASVGGCALFAEPIAEKVASAVEKYCEEPHSYRTIYRNTVNAQLTISGHVVHVHCAGDPNSENFPE